MANEQPREQAIELANTQAIKQANEQATERCNRTTQLKDARIVIDAPNDASDPWCAPGHRLESNRSRHL
jgi:hypothetical protein